jgi:aryl-alcohol dehydrogenase-like predicted oxidoreductase
MKVGEVGIGAMQFGDPRWQGPELDEVRCIVEEAVALGSNFIDTAPPYALGRSEELLGEVLQGRRDRFVLCTKFGYTADGREDFSAGRLEEAVADSLRRLRTDYLDVLLLHSPPDALMVGSAPHYGALRRLKDAGVLRAYGISMRRGTCDEIRGVLQSTDVQVIEIRFNALHQEPLPAIEEAAARGVGIIVNVPLESGWLSGKYGAESTFDAARARWTRDQIVVRSQRLHEFERLLPAGTSTLHGGLRYILAQPGVSTVIPGTKSARQLRDNVTAAAGTLSADVLQAIGVLRERQLRDGALPW